MCVLCEGGSEEDLLRDEFMRIALDGFTVVLVESESPWAYTIGLTQSFDHPELVVTGGSEDSTLHVLGHLIGRIKDGARFEVDSPPFSPCDCLPYRFGPVHPAQWEQGRFDQWLRYYTWAGGELPPQRALQVLVPNNAGGYPDEPDFCFRHNNRCQPLLDEAPRHNVNTGENREARRRRKWGHGQRRRR